MEDSRMHDRATDATAGELSSIAEELGSILETPCPKRPTKADYNALVSIRIRLEYMPGSNYYRFTLANNTVRIGLLDRAVARIRELEAFYYGNGSSWAA